MLYPSTTMIDTIISAIKYIDESPAQAQITRTKLRILQAHNRINPYELILAMNWRFRELLGGKKLHR